MFSTTVCTMILSRYANLHRRKALQRIRTLSTTLRGRSNSTIQADKEYIDTIQELFKMTYIPGRNQKHANETLFAARKVFFNALAKEYGMNKAKIIHIAGSKGKARQCIVKFTRA